MRFVLTAMVLGLSTAATVVAEDALAARQQKEAREHYRTGETLMNEESFEKAAVEFRMATRLDPAYTLAFYSLGQANMALNRYDDAATAYETCRETIEARARLDTRQRGELRQEREDELREIEAAMVRWGGGGIPNETTMKLEQRRRLIEQQQEKEAADRVEIPPELSIALGSAYFRLGRLPEAEGEYLAAVSGGDKTGAAHNNVAVIYMMTERLEQAAAAIRLAEDAGFRVKPQFKEDLEQRAASARQ